MSKKFNLNVKLDTYEKAYVKQYIKTNMRLIIVSVIILTLIVRNILPGNVGDLAFRFFGDYYGGLTQGYFNELFMVICVMAYIVPLYQFRFLMKRSSCDLYLSLPISRERLYYLQYLIGALFIIAVGLFQGVLVLGSCMLAKGLSLLLFVMVILFCILGICLYSFFTMIVVRCNTMLDAIVVTGLFTLVPMVFHNAIQYFLLAVEDEVLVSAVSYSSNTLYNQLAQLITSFISVPWLLHLWVYVADYREFAISFSFLIIGTLYWFLLGFACYCWGKSYFIRSRSEDREQRTSASLTYPLLIPAFAFVLLLQFGVGKHAWISIVIVGIIYSIALFFAQRRIHISIKHILIYGAMVVVVLGGYRICVNTNLFYSIKEIPNLEDVGSIELDVHIYDNTRTNVNESLEVYGANSKGAIENSDAIQMIINGNEKIAEKLHREGLSTEKLYGWVNLNYIDHDLQRNYRSYYVGNEEEILFLKGLIEEWVKHGVDLEIYKGE